MRSLQYRLYLCVVPLLSKYVTFQIIQLTGEGATPAQPTPIEKTQEVGVETASNDSMTTNQTRTAPYLQRAHWKS